ncbi:MAG: hypothetical protein AB9869_08685 [Verrucomicrobiia bacterium]
MKVSFALAISLLTLAVPAQALILTGRGNQPVPDHGWPVGAVEVANLPSRIGWWEGPPFGGGEWHFEYRGDTQDFEQALAAFAKVQAPVLDLFVHDGRKNSFVLDPNNKQGTNTIDWSFTVWLPESWNRLYGSGQPIFSSDDPNAGKPMPPPRVDLFLSSTGRIVFDEIALPARLTLHDERAATAGVDTTAGSVFHIAVTDIRTHLPLPGARVAVTTRDERGQYTRAVAEVWSDASGAAVAKEVPAGVFRISAGAPGYVEAAIAYGEFPARSFRKFEVHLASAGEIAGVVVEESGAPVPGLKLVAANTLIAKDVPYRTLHKPEAVTDSAGCFNMTGLPVGLVQVRVRSTDYFQPSSFDWHPVPATELVLQVKPCGSLLVRVVDGNGSGIQQWENRQVQVSVTPTEGSKVGSWGGSANVGSNGTYLFAGVHPTSYVLSVLNSDVQQRVTVKPREQAEVVLTLP